MKPINWTILGDAIRAYTGMGYTYVEVPWAVPNKIVDMTVPHPDFAVRLSEKMDGTLVGSAEQSFMFLQKKDLLAPGRYVACSPCFRNEPVVNDLRQPTFMKVELYCNDVKPGTLDLMIDHAWSFFTANITRHDQLRIVDTHEGFDIELNSVEIGSYGVRKIDGMHWAYGTGVAEPRFSYVRL
jgi:hypothetical protein